MKTEDLNTSLANNMSPTHRKTVAATHKVTAMPGAAGGEVINTSAAIVGT